jgi:exopolyphosphatase/guanosine-5'-triphosphate,3'-diphosphate pyrophosphatase
VKVHLVRHARAVPRADWQRVGESRQDPVGDPATGSRRVADNHDSSLFDLLRPLSDAGCAQAEALAEHLLQDPPERLLSSPALRCQQTLEPLALALGLPVEVDDRLADGEAIGGVSALIGELGEARTVLSTHSASIRALLEPLELDEETDQNGPLCRKGAVWTLEGSAEYALERATYFEPSQNGKSQRRMSNLSREIARPSSIRAAVLDMGSTSFTLLIADISRDGLIQPVVREKVMLRLGAAMSRNDKIPSPLARQVVEVARELHRIALPEKVEYFLPVATAALRDARNGRKLADKIARSIGEPVRILDGETEARLMFSAFQQRLRLADERVLGLDLGGGSLELAVGCGKRIEGECTLPLGVVRLRRELEIPDLMRPRDSRRVREHVHRALAPYRDALIRQRPDRMIVAGGTPRAIARLVAAGRGTSSAGDSPPIEVGLDELRAMTKRLTRASHEERLAMPGIRRRRADLVATGALVLLCVAESLGLHHFTFSDWGLREGVLLELMANAEPRVIDNA